MSAPRWSRELTIHTPEEMHELGVTLGRALQAGDVVLLTGALGAGKTTLTRGIGEGMQVRGPVTSPTFVLARTHPSLIAQVPLVHVDAYRLGSADELDDLDLDFEAAAVVIEWGKGMLDPGDTRLEVTLTRQAGHELDENDEEAETRTVHIEGFGARWAKGITDA